MRPANYARLVLETSCSSLHTVDRQVVVERPHLAGREAILKVHARKVKLASAVDLHVVAARTAGMVGADLANIINEPHCSPHAVVPTRSKCGIWKRPSTA